MARGKAVISTGIDAHIDAVSAKLKLVEKALWLASQLADQLLEIQGVDVARGKGKVDAGASAAGDPTVTTGRRRPGRPKTKKEPTTSATGRRRGRPRKVQAAGNGHDVEAEASLNAKAAAAFAPPKRRGRPPKNRSAGIDTFDTAEVEAEAEAEAALLRREENTRAIPTVVLADDPDGAYEEGEPEAAEYE